MTSSITHNISKRRLAIGSPQKFRPIKMKFINFAWLQILLTRWRHSRVFPGGCSIVKTILHKPRYGYLFIVVWCNQIWLNFISMLFYFEIFRVLEENKRVWILSQPNFLLTCIIVIACTYILTFFFLKYISQEWNAFLLELNDAIQQQLTQNHVQYFTDLSDAEKELFMQRATKAIEGG
jgi:hypothetical protein